MKLTAPELPARNGDLTIFGVADEDGGLDRSNHEYAALASVDGDLGSVIKDEDLAVLKIVDLEHAAFEVARLLDEGLPLQLLEDQVFA